MTHDATILLDVLTAETRRSQSTAEAGTDLRESSVNSNDAFAMSLGRQPDGHAESVNDVSPSNVQEVCDGEGSFESRCDSAHALTHMAHSSDTPEAHNTTNGDSLDNRRESLPDLRVLRGDEFLLFAVLCVSLVKLQTGAAQ